jgi:hypothetical protein
MTLTDEQLFHSIKLLLAQDSADALLDLQNDDAQVLVFRFPLPHGFCHQLIRGAGESAALLLSSMSWMPICCLEIQEVWQLLMLPQLPPSLTIFSSIPFLISPARESCL